MSALSSLHLGGKYSDLTVLCKSRQWAVHRAIVCSRSGFFDGACSNDFREAKTGVVDLSEDDEEAVGHMIHYFYHLDYLNPNAETETPSEVFRHRQLANERRLPIKKLDLSAIEDPLFVQAAAAAHAHAPPTSDTPMASPPPAGRQEAGSYFDTNASVQSKARAKAANSQRYASSSSGSDADSGSEEEEEYETDESNLLAHTRVYALAEKYDIPALKDLARSKFEMAMACYYDSPEFADAIDEVYSSTVDNDRGLRDIVLQAFRSHPQLASTQDVFEVIKHTPNLAFELWKIERGVPI